MKKLLPILLVISLLSCEEILTEPNISNEVVSILAPSSNSNLGKNTAITFSWQEVNGAAHYQLQIARPSFSNALQIQLDSIIYARSFKLDSLKANNYEWRVKAMNSGYETGYNTSGFIVE